MNDNISSEQAAQALRNRGIENAEKFMAYGTAEEILRACRRYDRRQNVGPGVLAMMIREREFGEPETQRRAKPEILRERFREYCRRYPVGAVVEAHRSLVARRWLDDLDSEAGQCPGSMVVADAVYPTLVLECNRCQFVASLGPRHLHVLGCPNSVPDTEPQEESWPF